MSHQAAVEFLKHVTTDVVRRAKAAEDAAALAVEAGHSTGHDFTRRELKEVATAYRMAQLSQEELAKVAGGVPAVGPIARLMSQVDLSNVGPIGAELVGELWPEPWAG